MTLDSLGRKREAATAYSRFADAYPRDRARRARSSTRVTYMDGTSRGIRRFALASRTRDSARRSAAAADRGARPSGVRARTPSWRASEPQYGGELRGAVGADCPTLLRAGGRLQRYRSLTLRSTTAHYEGGRPARRSQEDVSTADAEFTRAIEGTDIWRRARTTSAAQTTTEFHANVECANLTDAERQATRGSCRGRDYYNAARRTWQTLLEKAEQEEALRNDPGARPWLDRAREAVGGNVPSTPPTEGATAGNSAAGRMN